MEADESDYAETQVKMPADQQESVPALMAPEQDSTLVGAEAGNSSVNSGETMLQQRSELFELQQLVPLELDSAGRLLKIQDNSQAVFGGRFDAASVCELLGTLEEGDLRILRNHLHAALPDSIPATAGRQLARRNAGSAMRLVEDCWALGYSTANGVLTSRANSSTLRPAGRNPLEPLPPPSSNISAVINSMETLVASHLRLEAGFTGQQRAIDGIRSELAGLRGLRDEMDELRVLRGRVAELRAAVDDRDSRITHLEAQVAELLSMTGTVHRQQQNSPSGNTQLASEVAALINVRDLGVSIAAALRSGAGDSDSDTCDESVWPSLAPDTARQRGAATRKMRAQQHPANRALGSRTWAEAAATSRPPNEAAAAPAARREESRVSTASASSGSYRPIHGGELRPTAATLASVKPAETLAFLLEGVRPETADSRVRNLVQELTTSLHNFQRVKRHSGARQGLKAFRFDVDRADEAVVMDPSSWPMGLRVRPWTVKPVDRSHATVSAQGPGRSEGPRRHELVSTALSGRQLGAALRTPHQALSSATEDSTSARLNSARVHRITGSGPTSELVVTGSPDSSSSTAAFLLDGIRPEASDAQVRNLVWPLVSNLHQCHRVRRGGAQVGAKAYRIVVDTEDGDVVLNPANWPTGLRVCAWSHRHAQPF